MVIYCGNQLNFLSHKAFPFAALLKHILYTTTVLYPYRKAFVCAHSYPYIKFMAARKRMRIIRVCLTEPFNSELQEIFKFTTLPLTCTFNSFVLKCLRFPTKQYEVFFSQNLKKATQHTQLSMEFQSVVVEVLYTFSFKC